MNMVKMVLRILFLKNISFAVICTYTRFERNMKFFFVSLHHLSELFEWRKLLRASTSLSESWFLWKTDKWLCCAVDFSNSTTSNESSLTSNSGFLRRPFRYTFSRYSARTWRCWIYNKITKKRKTFLCKHAMIWIWRIISWYVLVF